ncbi:insulin-like growth factor-binding protein 3 [Conger conger]|uniref:insulin-like growth factor-binding protein 3 n=1 Tax=Conger conger TaxID=82655 RepID=UPI002A5AA1E8|nr:insulin-like growth factor-binding protein 3 [Conger conger]
MMSSLRLLCLIAQLSVTQLAEAGPVVMCEPCDVASVSQCTPVPSDCAEKVREPGCGCCMTCALREGQSCGIYTNRCGTGLTCQGRPAETRPLLALLEGRGICSRSTSGNGTSMPARGEDNTTDEDVSSRGGVTAPKAEGDEDKMPRCTKARPPAGGAGTDVPKFTFESKLETENGPCRRELESVLKSLKLRNIVYPQALHIPNCDKKGFYKKKQCRPSRGRQRGFCWCVDKNGQPLPVMEGTERGDGQCYSPENL